MDEVREFSKGGYVKMRTKGGGGKITIKFCARGRHKWKVPNGSLIRTLGANADEGKNLSLMFKDDLSCSRRSNILL